MTDDDVDTAGEYFRTRPSAEVCMVGEPSAEQFFYSRPLRGWTLLHSQNPPPGNSLAITYQQH